ncbi:MAG: hypothetical protein COY47_03290, partial [Chloroflexi bacterium CG_4_10_14_0_8_um_filter_57_5]
MLRLCWKRSSRSSPTLGHWAKCSPRVRRARPSSGARARTSALLPSRTTKPRRTCRRPSVPWRSS